MAAKIVVNDGRIQTETVAQNLGITRSYMGAVGQIGNSLTPSYNVYLSYVDNEFLLDAEGNRTRLITQGMNSKHIGYSQEKVITFMTKTITVDGVETTLGEYLADLMDAEILADINNPSTPQNP